MFINVHSPTTIDSYLEQAFALNKDAILALQAKQFNQENIRGTSEIPMDIALYYYAVYYVILIYLEVQQGTNNDWDYYKEKYDIDKYRKCLACHKIDLDDILAIFGLPIVEVVSGIEEAEIESTFIVEDVYVVPSTTTEDIQHLVSVHEETHIYTNDYAELDTEYDYDNNLIS